MICVVAKVIFDWVIGAYSYIPVIGYEYPTGPDGNPCSPLHSVLTLMQMVILTKARMMTLQQITAFLRRTWSTLQWQRKLGCY